jgi:hypothetical protein
LLGSFDRFPHSLDLVGAQIVHEYDITLPQCRCQHLLDIGEERRPIHRAVDDIGRREAIDAQRSDKGQRFPMAVRYIPDEAYPARGESVVPDHLRRCRRLINKHVTPRIEDRLLGLQHGACSGDVRTILLGGAQRLKVIL